MWKIDYSFEQLFEVCSTLLGQLNPGDNVLLDAPLGAGKTTLVQTILKEIGYKGSVQSPSYGLMHHYSVFPAGEVSKPSTFWQKVMDLDKNSFSNEQSVEGKHATYELCHDVYHFDLYRAGEEDEFYRLGMDEIFAGPGLVFVEWAENNALCEKFATKKITLDVCGVSTRKLSLTTI